MKLRILVLILALTCFLLVACEEDNFLSGLLGGLGGSTTDEEYVETTYLYDALYSALEKQDYLKAVSIAVDELTSKEVKEGEIHPKLASGFPDLARGLEAHDRDVTFRALAELMFQQTSAPGTVETCMGRTFTADGKDVPAAVTLEEQGISHWDGEVRYWFAEGNDRLWILDNMGNLLYAELKATSFDLLDADGKRLATYAVESCEDLKSYEGTWTAVTLGGEEADPLTVTVETFYLSLVSQRYGEPSFQVTTREKDRVSLVNVHESAIRMTLITRDGKDLLILTDTLEETPAMRVYYRADKGYDGSWPEVAYLRAMYLIRNLELGNEHVLATWYEPVPLARQQAMSLAQELLTAAAPYADVSAYQKRFTALKNVVLSASDVSFAYDVEGTLLTGYDIMTPVTFFGCRVFFADAVPHRYSYDSKGRISKITVTEYSPENGSPVESYVAYTYTKKGELESVRVESVYLDATFYPFYDMDGNLLELTGSYLDEQGEEMMLWINYSRDPETGRLNGELAWYRDGNGNFHNRVTSYEYDKKGRITTVSVYYDYENDSDDVTDTITYTYDKNGTVTAITCQGSDGMTNKISCQIGDYFFLDGNP